MGHLWRQLEHEAHALSETLEPLAGTVAQQREHPEIARQALLSLLDDLDCWTWDLEIACQQLAARRPTQRQAEQAMIFAF
ncbi:hypothetical protein HIJ39_15930, partial [Sulfobacillus sp. DSM 109850]|nr:hypothetical protein [Sulfobacillus harzensis]